MDLNRGGDHDDLLVFGRSVVSNIFLKRLLAAIAVASRTTQGSSSWSTGAWCDRLNQPGRQKPLDDVDLHAVLVVGVVVVVVDDHLSSMLW